MPIKQSPGLCFKCKSHEPESFLILCHDMTSFCLGGLFSPVQKKYTMSDLCEKKEALTSVIEHFDNTGFQLWHDRLAEQCIQSGKEKCADYNRY